MNVQATKLELMQLILESNNSDLLDSVPKLLNSYKLQKSAPIKLSEEERDAIREGAKDFKNGNFSKLSDFMKELE